MCTRLSIIRQKIESMDLDLKPSQIRALIELFEDYALDHAIEKFRNYADYAYKEQLAKDRKPRKPGKTQRLKK